MKRIEIDFSNIGSVLDGLSQIYNISSNDIMKLSQEIPDVDELLLVLFERYNIHPDVHKLDEVFIQCNVVGKYPDKNLLKSEGLMSLKELLKRDYSFLSRFLKNEDIFIDVTNETFSYHDKTIQIDPESNLGVKLIHDKGEIEAFYYATKTEMINYSTVSKYPEILLTIDQFVKEYFDENTNLGDKWSHLVSDYDIISFYVNINDTTYINGKLDKYEVSTYENCCKKEPLYSNSEPQTLYNNVWLLTYGINRIRDELHGELSLGISNKVIIPYNELDIYPQQ